MTKSYDLTQLDSYSFEHMVNALAMRELGSGHTGFSPGADGGRDGYYEGKAPYPSTEEMWTGVWYIQSKFHKPSLSTDEQKWLQKEVKAEVKEFVENRRRRWPNNWIVCTNIDPSGKLETGSFDLLRKFVTSAHQPLNQHFHIWGGRKIIDLLDKHKDVRDRYGHFLTPGHVLTRLYSSLEEERATVESVVRELVVRPFKDEIHTKLDQAGSESDDRPGIHKLFIDLPFIFTTPRENQIEGYALRSLVKSCSEEHRHNWESCTGDSWRQWRMMPDRAPVWFVIGGPGQGKSTLGQFHCQIQRAALILEGTMGSIHPTVKTLATEVKADVVAKAYWPSVPRIPVSVELKDYAHWLSMQETAVAKGILSYIAYGLSRSLETAVSAKLLERCLKTSSWFFAFDGLDEVPGESKNLVAREVQHFIEEVAVRNNCDLVSICTSRPQGYSGEFDSLQKSTLHLRHLNPDEAFECARPVLGIQRSEKEISGSEEILRTALETAAVRDLMKTPLQSHIMAVVVRDGKKPPDRRWQLFDNFYNVMLKREANKATKDSGTAKLLQEQPKLLRSIHNRLGFVLHAEAESPIGATTSLARPRFKQLCKRIVEQMIDGQGNELVETLMHATENRLVLVNTPENGGFLRFDVRQLQEFFAAEFLYNSVDATKLRERLGVILGDSHWREVSHFLLSALVENDRQTELSVAIEILLSLDGTESGPVRLTERRLGLGALTASRLMQEGVLEQDKRMRQRFRSCLDAICAFTWMPEGDNLSLVTQPASRSWVINYLIEELHEKAKSESIGACAILFRMVLGGDELWPKVEQAFVHSSIDYQDAVLSCYTDMKPEDEVVPLHIAGLIVDRLLGADWKSITKESLRSYLNLVGRIEGPLSQLVQYSNLVEEEVALLDGFVDRNKRHDAHTIDGIEVDFGIVRGTYIKQDWTECLVASNDLKLPDIARGILQLPNLIVRFSRTHKRHDFLNVLKFFGDRTMGLFSNMQPHFRSLIPVIEEDVKILEMMQIVEAMSEEDFRESLRTQSLGRFKLKRSSLSFTINGNSLPVEVAAANFIPLIEQEPMVAAHTWFRRLVPWIHKELGEEDRSLILDAFQRSITCEPEVFLSFASIWGDVFTQVKEPEKVKQALRDAAANSSPPERRFFPTDIAPFPLCFDVDIPLLPHVQTVVVEYLDMTSLHGHPEDQSASIINVVTAYATLETLSEIASRSDLSARTRVSAIFMIAATGQLALLLESRDLVFSELNRDFDKLGVSECLGVLLEKYGNPADESHRRFVGELLDRTRSDFRTRFVIERALARWREKTSTPLRRSGLLTKWLEGDE